MSKTARTPKKPKAPAPSTADLDRRLRRLEDWVSTLINLDTPPQSLPKESAEEDQ